MPTPLPTKPHWEHVYSSRSVDTVSWYQPHAKHSLALIQATGEPRSADWPCSSATSAFWTYPPQRCV